MTQEFATFLKVWFFISPFIILYLYRKSKETSAVRIKATPEIQ